MDGRTLYTFDADSDGKSNCDRACAKIWPPYTYQVESQNPSLPGDWSVVIRDDGTKMWALAGKPLYYFVGDQAPGESKGNGAGGVWHVARPTW